MIHKENGGQAQARNRALDICKGDYITFLDSDDFLHVDYIDYLVRAALNTNADIVQCDYVRGLDTTFPIINRSIIEETFDNHSIFLSEKANVIVCGKLYRREILLNNRIKEGRYYEDDFTTWKWYYTANKIVVSNRALYYYTVNPNSTMAGHKKKPSFDFMDAYKERIAFFVGTGEKDLEHCSRLQLCKSLLLTYGHSKLSEEERRMVKEKFDENLEKIKHSPYIRSFYKALLVMVLLFVIYSTFITTSLLVSLVVLLLVLAYRGTKTPFFLLTLVVLYFTLWVLNKAGVFVDLIDVIYPYFDGTAVDSKLDDIRASLIDGEIQGNTLVGREDLHRISWNSFFRSPIWGTSIAGGHSAIVDRLGGLGLLGGLPFIMMFISFYRMIFPRLLPYQIRYFFITGFGAGMIYLYEKGLWGCENWLMLMVMMPSVLLAVTPVKK